MPFDGDSRQFETTAVKRLFLRPAEETHKGKAREAIVVLDMLLELFEGGKNWMQTADADDTGRYCLRGGLTCIRAKRGREDRAAVFLGRAIKGLKGEIMSIPFFNDQCRDYSSLEEAITRARELALLETVR